MCPFLMATGFHDNQNPSTFGWVPLILVQRHELMWREPIRSLNHSIDGDGTWGLLSLQQIMPGYNESLSKNPL